MIENFRNYGPDGDDLERYEKGQGASLIAMCDGDGRDVGTWRGDQIVEVAARLNRDYGMQEVAELLGRLEAIFPYDAMHVDFHGSHNIVRDRVTGKVVVHVWTPLEGRKGTAWHVTLDPGMMEMPPVQLADQIAAQILSLAIP